MDDGDDVPVDIDAVDQDMLEPEDGSAEVDDVEDIDAATTADDVDAEVVDETDVVEDLVEEEEEVKPAVEPVPLTGVRAVGRPRSRADEAETLKLWKTYKAGATQQLRNRLIERYMHIVNFSAERMHARLPGEVDVDDLKQAGLFGLMDSIDAR